MSLIWIFYLMLLVAIVRLTVSLVNLITRPLLPKAKPKEFPLVSVLIPARNEEKNISNLLNSIVTQDYPNLEIIIGDDESTDNTVSIVEKWKSKDSRIKLIHIESLPEGWLGKNYACHLLGNIAKGDYFVFLDADVVLSESFISSAISYMKNNNISLLSIFPEQIMKTSAEKIVVPIMMRILLSLLPLPLVKLTRFPSLSAANGQCMIYKKSVYLKYFPNQLFKKSRAEDIEIAKYLKSQGELVVCLLGNHQIYSRMYTNYSDAINGFAKNIDAIFHGSYLLAFLYGLMGNSFPSLFMFLINLKLYAIIFCLMYMTFVFNMINSNLKNLTSLRLFFIQDIVFWNILFKSIRYKIKKYGEWKGRNIYF